MPINVIPRIAPAALAAFLIVVVTVPYGAAQSGDGFDGGFDGGFAAGGDSTTGDTTGGNGGGDDFSGGFSADSGASDFGGAFSLTGPESALQWNGRVEVDLRATVDEDDPAASPVDGTTLAEIELSWEGDSSEVVVRGRGDTGDETPQIDEAYLSLFYDTFSLSAGYIKTVWGTGDQVHVVDLLNSTDYTDFINPDYLDRRIAVSTALVRVPLGERGATRLEVAWIPTFTPDTFAEEGAWRASDVAALEATVESYGEELAAWYIANELSSIAGATLPPTDPVVQATAAALAAAAAEDAIRYESTDSLEYGQYAARLSTSLGGVDAAATIYRGFLKTPSPEFHFANSAGTGPSTNGYLELDYDPLWAFGIDAAAALAGINLRGEVAYYLTDDVDGDDPAVPNNSIEYVGGFDVDIPGVGTNVNIQLVGSYLLQSDTIDDAGYVANGTASSLLNDPDAILNYQWDADGIYTRNIASAALTDSFANERILPTVSFAMDVEHGDYRGKVSVEFVLRDDARLEIEGVTFGGDETGYFGQYDANDFVAIRASYAF